MRILVVLGAGALLASLPPLAYGQGGARNLVAVTAPGHDPLFVDAASVRRQGSVVSFKYVLDVFAPPEGNAAAGAWRSNEIEARIDCALKTFFISRLVAYPGPKASGAATAVHSFLPADQRSEKIGPKSTFAYLADHLCRGP